jgi:hypothetical protein
MTMLRTLSAEQLIDALDDGVKANNAAPTLAAVQPGLDAFRGILKGLGEVKEGTTVGLDFAQGVTTIVVDGTPRGTIAGDAFNAAMLRVWLGDRPVQDDLKQQLLGA